VIAAAEARVFALVAMLSDMDYRTSKDFTPIIALPLLLEKRHFRAASTDPFATQGAVLSTPDRQQRSATSLERRHAAVDRRHRDTNRIATRDSMAAVIDRAGCLYVSHDDGVPGRVHLIV